MGKLLEADELLDSVDRRKAFSARGLPQATIDAMAPQLRLVYDYLMTGRTLSGLIAMTNLAVMNLTTRIAELRKLGLKIEGEWADDYRGRRYKAYWVKQEGETK